MTKITTTIMASLIALLPLGLVSCASTSTSESAGQYIDNTAITTKVKAQLFNKLGSKGFDIKVKSYKDTVQLSGFVDSDAIKRRAENITRRVDGVRKVTNNILVK